MPVSNYALLRFGSNSDVGFAKLLLPSLRRTLESFSFQIAAH